MKTNAEIIAEIRKPGKVTVPVLMDGDVCRIVAEKSDLIDYIEQLDPAGPCPWAFVSGSDGRRNLDIQD